jgi:hypothetical protein
MSDHRSTGKRMRSRLRIGSGIRVIIAGLLLASSAVVISPVAVSAEGCTAVSYDNSVDPIQIQTVGHLSHLAATPADWGESFIQTADIDLAGCPWVPIGTFGVPFTGSYDGAGKDVRNLSFNNPNANRVGMFGTVVDSSLSNIKLVDIALTGQEDVGGLVGEAVDSTISATSVTGSVTGRAGGSGRNGGLVGAARGGSISGSFAHVTVIGGTREVGGLVGIATPNFGQDPATPATNITASYATGDVTGSGKTVGGLVGLTRGPITNSFATGNVAGIEDLGGLAGEADRTTIRRSWAGGNVSGTRDQIGGLVGLALSVDIQDAYALGDVQGRNRVGGLIGTLNDSGAVVRSYSIGNVAGVVDLGGLVGFVGGAGDPVSSVTASFWDVTTSTQETSAGGVGQTTEAMKVIGTFGGWDIDTSWSDSKVWGICDVANGGYPYLTWQFPGGAGLATSCGGTGLIPNPPSNPPLEAPSGADVPLTETATAPTPVPVNGALPQNAPGEVTVYEDGQPVTVRIFVEDDTELVLQGSDFELRLSGECASGCTITETAAGRQVLTLEEDGGARTEGRGFLPGSKVDIWMFSEPRYLGQLTVRADGTFAGTVQLVGVAVGEHTLQVNGISLSGAQRSANIGVVVKPAQSTPALGLLPATGVSLMSLLWQAMSLIGVGVLALGSRRLRTAVVARRM